MASQNNTNYRRGKLKDVLLAALFGAILFGGVLWLGLSEMEFKSKAVAIFSLVGATCFGVGAYLFGHAAKICLTTTAGTCLAGALMSYQAEFKANHDKYAATYSNTVPKEVAQTLIYAAILFVILAVFLDDIKLLLQKLIGTQIEPKTSTRTWTEYFQSFFNSENTK